MNAITTGCLRETGFDASGVRHGRMWANDAKQSLVSAGEVLVARSNTADLVGRAAMVLPGHVGLVATDLTIRVRPRDEINPAFLALYLSALYVTGYWKTRAGGASGSMKKITRGQVESLRVPVAPKSEQLGLISMMTQMFEEVERARAAAEMRLEAAKVLPAGYLRSVFDRGREDDCRDVQLGAVLSLRKDVVHPREKPEGRATFVGLEHIESGTGHRTGSVEVDLADLTGRKPKFQKGDIVYGYLRPYLNKVWVAEFDGLCSVDQYVFRVDSKHADPHFIASFMRSPFYLRHAPISTTPGQLPRIRTEEVASVPIALPPIRQQRKLLNQLGGGWRRNGPIATGCPG